MLNHLGVVVQMRKLLLVFFSLFLVSNLFACREEPYPIVGVWRLISIGTEEERLNQYFVFNEGGMGKFKYYFSEDESVSSGFNWEIYEKRLIISSDVTLLEPNSGEETVVSTVLEIELAAYRDRLVFIGFHPHNGSDVDLMRVE